MCFLDANNAGIQAVRGARVVMALGFLLLGLLFLGACVVGYLTVITHSLQKVRVALRAGVAFVAASLTAVALPLASNAQPYAEGGASFAPDAPPAAFIAQRGSLSLAQATQIAQGRFRGRVVRAETVQQGNRMIHVIRILGDDGRVVTVRVDAETGAVM
jgi:Flp pilus assembly protein CpaB